MPDATETVFDDRQVLTISELTDRIKTCLQSQFSAIWVAGEVSDLSRPRSGHIYLALKDGNAQLRAVMWRTAASRLKFELEDGMEVLCQGEIDIYPPRGSYQLIIRRIELRGEGALQRALRQLQAKLADEGLFDPRRKRPLPAYPRRVAVITSPSGAAIRDFVQVARRRWRGTELLVMPVRVQGVGAAAEITRAVETANRLVAEFDVIVVTRGGGSIEDLWSFNEESVVRAIAASRIPVVSAVGHEIDVTLSDLVADVRAATPSEAAELVMPSTEQVRHALQGLGVRLRSVLQWQFDQAQNRLAALAQRRVLRRPEERILELTRHLDVLDSRGQRAIDQRLERARHELSRRASQLETLSPLAVLGRGYCISQRFSDNQVVRSVGQVNVGDGLKTRLADGEIDSRIEKITKLKNRSNDQPAPDVTI